uniref:Uncharacterized protein n=2 Tax=Lutzomyia longipalpis TaxID=7200 RepID=A0A1B0CV79_LUTLO
MQIELVDRCLRTPQGTIIQLASVRTDRLMTLLPIPPDCVALEELPPSQCLKGVFMELLGSLQHPYIYPVLDLGFVNFESRNYACLVTPFNPRGSLKDLIYKSQWNEAWCRKYTRKSTCLPISQVQRLGRQILEALLFLRERGFSSHGHLHSGNVILQNGVARLSGLENGILGLNSNINAISSLVRNEKFKRLTHAAFSSRMAGSRHVLWKNSIMARKQTVKSNESLLDTSPTRSLETKVSPVRDLGESLAPWNSWKSRSERTLFSLADFKQPALETSSCHAEDFTSDEEDTSTRVASSGDSSNTSKPPEEPEKSLDSSEEVEDADESSDFLSSPSHEYMCKLIGSGGEETPLLEGMEMSPISPKE